MLKTICFYGSPISVPILIFLFVKRGDHRNLSGVVKFLATPNPNNPVVILRFATLTSSDSG